MMTDEDYNKDGSWIFPPRPRSAGQHVAFWSKAQIPDEVLARLIKTFRQLTLDDLKTHSAQIEKGFTPIWRANNPGNLAGRFFQAIDSDVQARKRVALDTYALSRAHEFLGNGPIEIAPMDARTIARASLIYSSPQQFTRAEWDWVLGFPIELSTGTTTVQGVEDAYRLGRMRSVLQTPPDTITDVLAELGALSEKVRQISLKIDSLDTKIGQK